MIDVLYFARFAEALDTNKEQIALNDINTADDLIDLLHKRGSKWQNTLNQSALIAINQTMSKRSDYIQDGDEIAFFPPVSGG